MSSELQSSTPVFDNEDTGGPVWRDKEGHDTSSAPVHVSPLTTRDLQDAAEITPSDPFVRSANEIQNAPSVSNIVGHSTPPLHQSSSSPPKAQRPSSPETLSNESHTHIPRGLPTNYQFTRTSTGNSGQRHQNRSSSLPQAPSHFPHPQSGPMSYTPQSRPMFYTPQLEPHRSTVGPPGNMIYSHPVHSSQRPIGINMGSPYVNRNPPPDSIALAPQKQFPVQTSDAFVPNDPFRVHKGNQERETDLTFDDMHITPVQQNFGQYPGQNEAYSNFNEGKATRMPSMSPWSQPIQQSWNQSSAPWGQPWQPWGQHWSQPSQPWSQSQGPWIPDSPSTVRSGGRDNLYGSTPSGMPSAERPSGKRSFDDALPILSTPGSPFPVPEQHQLNEGQLSDQTTTDEPILEPVLQHPLPEAHLQSSPHSSAKPSLETPENTADITTVGQPMINQNPVHDENSSFWSNLKRFFALPFARRIFHSRPDFVMPYYMRPPLINSLNRQTSLDRAVVQLVARTFPHQMYLYILLRLPSLYFSRVARIFEEADLTMREIKKMALETSMTDKGLIDLHIFDSQNVPPQYTRLKSTWEAFIDSVMREWKTFNIISVLLLSAILTILQIDSAAQQPITRYTALSSLICALISLLFGCMYIIRFGTMRKAYRAAEWALEAQKTRTTVWWNVWVLLAMPAIWLTWSILLYIVCIMSFIWLASAETDMNLSPTHMSPTTLLIVRVVISTVLGLGILYGALILSTFRRYGEVMDNMWKRRIDKWVEEKKLAKNSYSPGNFGPGHQTPLHYGGPGLPPNFQPYPLHSVPETSGDFAGTPWTPYRDFPPTFEPTHRPQQSSVHSEPPAVSPTTPLPPGEISYVGYGYFSDRKNLFSGVETEEPSSIFIPPLDAQESRTLNPLRQDTANSALSSLHFAASPERTDKFFANQSSVPLPGTSSSGYDIPISIAGIGSSVSQDNALGLRSEPDEIIEEGQELRTRAVRFRSPLVSPEVTQLENPIQASEEGVTPVDSMYFNVADTSVSTTARARTPIDIPRSATAEAPTPTLPGT